MISPAIKLSLTQLLTKSFIEKFHPRQLVVEHSYRDGYFCHDATWEEISEQEISDLEVSMKEWVLGPDLIIISEKPRDEVLTHMMTRPSVSKTANVHMWPVESIPIIKLGDDYWDYLLESAETDKSRLAHFCLEKFNDGFLLRFFENETAQNHCLPFTSDSGLFRIIGEIEQMGDILDISTIHQVNKLVQTGEINQMLWVAEGYHEKQISHIADAIVQEFPSKRVISIAGPSSSGKTTFAKRLGIQLRVNGFRTLTLSMDDYFVNRTTIKPDENGSVDYESIDAVDVELLVSRIQTLLNGGSVPVREYDFILGEGKDKEETIHIGEWDLIIMEGIHGLNPQLTHAMGNTEFHHIYVSAITQLNIDSNHRFSTSDNRLLRRLVRDHLFRGYTPQETLERWHSVRLGEERNIFPFQEEADFMFNSSLLYELSVLAPVAIPLLEKIPSPSNMKGEADRLRLVLSLVEPLSADLVPGISILREFIGNSDFHY